MLQIITKSIVLRRSMPTATTTSLVRRTFADEHNAKDGESKQDEQPAKKTEKSPAEAPSNRLNELLASMSKDSALDIVKTVVAAKPKLPKTDGGKRKKSDRDQAAPTADLEADVQRAARDVAASLGGDVKKTESELLAKLLHRSAAAEADGADAAPTTLGDLISGMQIDRQPSVKSTDAHPKRSHFVRKSIEHAQDRRAGSGQSWQNRGDDAQSQGERRPFQRRKSTLDPRAAAANAVSVNLFGEQPLGIFLPHAAELQPSPDILPTWSALQARDLQLAITHPPSNHFQKMALWTEQGKLWRFPIDNEQGLDEEAAVCFTEHIFLDRHLADWCPPRGPVRHFMELVCVGLSKNAFYTVAQKIEHIEWYRRYFEEKKELLQQVIIDQTAAAQAEAQAAQQTPTA